MILPCWFMPHLQHGTQIESFYAPARRQGCDHRRLISKRPRQMRPSAMRHAFGLDLHGQASRPIVQSIIAIRNAVGNVRFMWTVGNISSQPAARTSARTAHGLAERECRTPEPSFRK